MFHACKYKMRSACHRSYGNYSHLFRVSQVVCIAPPQSLVLCQTIHSLPLSAASHARTNHCHWALSDRTDTWGWGEITKTCVGVDFGLFSFCRKDRKKDPHVTRFSSDATEIKRSQPLRTACTQTSLLTLSTPYSLVILFDQSAMNVKSMEQLCQKGKSI